MPGLLDVVQLRTTGVDLDQDNATDSDRERREELTQWQRLPGPAVVVQAVLPRSTWNYMVKGPARCCGRDFTSAAASLM